MLAFVMASMMVVTADAPPVQVNSLKGQPTRHCRELGSAASRSQAIYICRTKTQWAKAEACSGPTRYCTPKERLALRDTAFPLNEASRILCKKTMVTGSRLAKVELCLPQREWDRMHTNSREEVRDLQDLYSKQPNNRDQ